MYKRGYKIVNISDIYQINESTVKRILKKNKDFGTLERKQGTGLKTKYNEDDLKKILIDMINVGYLRIHNYARVSGIIENSKMNLECFMVNK